MGCAKWKAHREEGGWNEEHAAHECSTCAFDAEDDPHGGSDVYRFICRPCYYDGKVCHWVHVDNTFLADVRRAMLIPKEER
jgi:hypothetical protein